MTRRTLAALVLTVAVLAGAAYWYAPRQALSGLEAALAERDVVGLERHVDWRRVRDGARADVTGYLTANAAGSVGGGHTGMAVGSMLAAAVGPPVVTFLVDHVVSPQGAIKLAAYREQADGRKLALAVERMEFTALDEFTVWVRWSDQLASARLVMAPEGLRWRVVRVVLPFEAWLAAYRGSGGAVIR